MIESTWNAWNSILVAEFGIIAKMFTEKEDLEPTYCHQHWRLNAFPWRHNILKEVIEGPQSRGCMSFELDLDVYQIKLQIIPKNWRMSLRSKHLDQRCFHKNKLAKYYLIDSSTRANDNVLHDLASIAFQFGFINFWWHLNYRWI